MMTLDGQDLFSSGPCTLQAGPWQRNVERRSMAGLDGEMIVDMGLRGRRIILKGWLQRPTPQLLTQALEAIEAFVDGQRHLLVDSFGREFPDVLLEQCEQAGAIRRGRGYWCEYTCQFLQMPQRD